MCVRYFLSVATVLYTVAPLLDNNKPKIFAKLVKNVGY